jgi:alpha-1,6-mannosyltransferase
LSPRSDRAEGRSTIVRLANFVTDSSGGLRTALRELGERYHTAGHSTVLVVPGRADSDQETSQGRVITLRGPRVPGTGGYRVLLGRARLRRLLEALAPDRLEVSDRTTLRWTGPWARRHGIPSMMVSHESLDGLLRLPTRGRLSMVGLADLLNARTAAGYDRVVCTTAWAAREFQRVGADNLVQVPLGVDLGHFHPDRYDPALRARYADRGELLLLHCGRLSPEKRPQRALAAMAALRDMAVPAALVVVGTGPRQATMRTLAGQTGLNVRFENYISDRGHLADLLATADIAIGPGPVETFGLAALEALASGTPVVISAESALPEIVGTAGRAVAGEGAAYAQAIMDLAAMPSTDRRTAARQRAERYPWSASVAGFLRAHGLEPVPAVSIPAIARPEPPPAYPGDQLPSGSG